MALGNPFVRTLVAILLLGGCSASDREANQSLPGGRAAEPRGLSNPELGLEARPQLADVTLPPRADVAATLQELATKMKVAFKLIGARPVEGAADDGAIVYLAAGPGGSDVTFRVSPTGAEDFVSFERKPAAEEVRYRVDVREAAGLRLVENVLELLDAAGVPRLRMGAPFVVDGRGRHDARVQLEDCAADHDPAGPWGRPVTASGRGECTLKVAWGGASDPIRYPATLDPKWTATTGAMTEARSGHTATLLVSGKVLIAGGESTAGALTTHSKTAELFDPATGTFAATGAMTAGRSFHAAALLSTNNVVVAGGVGATAALGATEIYDVTTSKFRAVGNLIVARAKPALVALGANQALIAGGQDATGAVLDSAELFNATAETWSTTDRMGAKRVGHYLAAPSGAAATVVAGITSSLLGDLAACERFAAGTWTASAGLAEPRHDFAGASFSDGKILVAGGFQASVGKVLATAELFDPSQAKWVTAGTLAHARTAHTLTALPSGAAVAAGGVVRDTTGKITSYLKSAELFDPGSNTWTALTDMAGVRAFHSATLLNDGRVLVAGGAGATGAAIATAEILALDADGTACTLPATCASGFCADGVCCKTACVAPCTACALAITGKASGTCAPVLVGKDPRGDCVDDGTPACGKDGLCDGAGACESYPAAPCTPKPCTDGKECTSGFCADGICCATACSGLCEACTAAKQGTGSDGTCGPIKATTDPDAECGKMGTGAICSADGTCDGAGACQVPTAGKACAPAACIDTETKGAAATCSTVGDCIPAPTSCIPFRCDAATTTCKSKCATDADCATGAHCKGGLCARSANGTACTAATDCTSTVCTDGLCCDVDCSGQCEACDVAGAEGTCTPVADTPHGKRLACAGTDPCMGRCNGLARMGCVYPVDTKCGTTVTCTDGNETADRCNNLGDCVATPKACAPFACGADACKTECATSADCASGSLCQAGACTLAGGGTCADGGTTRSDGGACPPPKRSGDSGGCGCRTAPRETPPANGAALALLLLGATLRRIPNRTKRGCSFEHRTRGGPR
jgi:MYXO-CTERM domain-containing protein